MSADQLRAHADEGMARKHGARPGRVTVITAGSSDLPVAEEVRETLAWMGVDVRLVQDVGVAGPHRLPARLAEFADADAIVVVAGMEGALPSVVGGYVPCPVFAVPTSVGYGANFGGVSALLSMLNSCAANVAVVNIDAGFKAGYLAGLVATRRAPRMD
jgi:NCAIR mutase (PurE)-related protein